MRPILVKLFALQKSLFIASRVAGGIVDSKWITAWNIPQIGANCGIWDVGWCPIWNEAWNVAWRKKGTMRDEIVDSIHSSVMKNYDAILSEMRLSASRFLKSGETIDYGQTTRKLLHFGESLEQAIGESSIFTLLSISRPRTLGIDGKWRSDEGI
jgi:hypothetical protein